MAAADPLCPSNSYKTWYKRNFLLQVKGKNKIIIKATDRLGRTKKKISKTTSTIA